MAYMAKSQPDQPPVQENRPWWRRTLGLLLRLWKSAALVLGSLVIAGYLALLLVMVLGAGVVQPSGQHVLKAGSQEQTVALVELSGPIFEDDSGSNPLSITPGVISSRRVIRLFDDLSQDSDIQAIVIRINSPGGGVVASDELYRKIIDVRQDTPVVVSIGEVAASGGYYLAAAADRIVANPASITGSIGVLAQLPQFSELFDKIGVEVRTIKSGEFKDLGASDRELTPAERQILQSVIDDSFEQFVQAIVTGRNMDEAEVRQLADGRIFTGRQALELGLIDELGTVETAFELAAQLAQLQDPQVIEYSDKTFLQQLLEARGQLSVLAKLERLVPASQFGVYYLFQF